VTAPSPVLAGQSQDQNPVHIACGVEDRTWCGEPADGWVAQVHVDQVCRLCLLVLELLAEGDPCPVCGSRACLQTP